MVPSWLPRLCPRRLTGRSHDARDPRQLLRRIARPDALRNCPRPLFARSFSHCLWQHRTRSYRPSDVALVLEPAFTFAVNMHVVRETTALESRFARARAVNPSVAAALATPAAPPRPVLECWPLLRSAHGLVSSTHGTARTRRGDMVIHAPHVCGIAAQVSTIASVA